MGSVGSVDVGWLSANHLAPFLDPAEDGLEDARSTDIERSEHDHRIQLDTLERAARAMGCELVCELLPARA